MAQEKKRKDQKLKAGCLKLKRWDKPISKLSFNNIIISITNTFGSGYFLGLCW